MKVLVRCGMSLSGCEYVDELDFDDEHPWTDEDIAHAVREWALEQFEWSWERAEEPAEGAEK